MSNNERIYWIDNLKGIGMIAIILGHSLFPLNSIFVKYLFTFHVPLFFFVAGILYNERKYDSFKLLFFDKVKRLLVPYIVFNVGLYICFYIPYLLDIRKLSMEPKTFLINTVRGIYVSHDSNMNILNNPTWFLPCLFSVSVIYFFINKCFKNRYIKLAVLLIISIAVYVESKTLIDIRFPFSIDTALMSVLFYGIAHTFKAEIITLVEKVNLKFILTIPLLVTISIIILNPTNMSMNQYGNYFGFIICAISGITTMVIISKVIGKKLIIEYIGKNSIIYNGMEWIKSPLIKMVSTLTLGIVRVENSNLTAIIQAITCIIAIAPVCFIVNKWFPFLIGGKNKKRKQI